MPSVLACVSVVTLAVTCGARSPGDPWKVNGAEWCRDARILFNRATPGEEDAVIYFFIFVRACVCVSPLLDLTEVNSHAHTHAHTNVLSLPMALIAAGDRLNGTSSPRRRRWWHCRTNTHTDASFLLFVSREIRLGGKSLRQPRGLSCHWKRGKDGGRTFDWLCSDPRPLRRKLKDGRLDSLLSLCQCKAFFCLPSGWFWTLKKSSG